MIDRKAKISPCVMILDVVLVDSMNAASKLRAYLDLSQAQMGESVDMGQSAISMLERGVRSLSGDAVLAWTRRHRRALKKLGLDAEDLLRVGRDG